MAQGRSAKAGHSAPAGDPIQGGAVGVFIIDAELNNLGLGATVLPSPWQTFAKVLWRRRIVIAASFAATVVIAGVYLLVAPQVLETSATVGVNVLDQLLPDSAVTAGNTLAEQPGIMGSTEVVALAIASPQVSGLPLLRGEYDAIGAVQANLAVRPGERPGEFELSLTSSRPVDAEKLLDSVIAAYISLETTQRVQSSDSLTGGLIDQQRKTAADLQVAKRRLNDTIKRRAELEPDPEAKRLYAQPRAEAAATLADARQKADDARGLYQRAVRFFGGEEKLNLAAGAISPTTPIATNDVDPDVLPDRILQLQHDARQHIGGKNSAYARQLAQLSAEYAAGVRERYQSALDRQNQAQSHFDELEKRTQDIDALEDESSRLQSEVDRLTSLDAELTERLSHSEAAGNNRVSITILKSAATGETPVWPRPLPIFAIAALAGVLLGCGLAATFDKFDTRLRDPGDARARRGRRCSDKSRHRLQT